MERSGLEKRRRPPRLLPALLLVVVSMQLSANNLTVRILENRRYVSFHELTHRFQFQKTFDMYTQKGKIYSGSHYAVFNVGFSVFIVDGEILRTDYEVIRHEGDVLIPASAVESILLKFYKGSAVTISDTSLDIEFDKKNILAGKKDDGEKQMIPRSEDDTIGFIIIDPGHGGKDPGAIGKRGIQEKKITLKVAQLLVMNLKSRFKSIPVLLTRSKDIFIPLLRRTEIANSHLKRKVNGIFLSIHVNASLSEKISGFETYFLSVNPTNEEARNTAALENNVVILEEKDSNGRIYGDVDYIEAMMLTTQIQKESSMLAESVQKGMDAQITKVKSRGVKKADFFVLRGALMPAALVEIGYVTNRKESGLLVEQAYQKEIADGIARGISSFIEQYNRMVMSK